MRGRRRKPAVGGSLVVAALCALALFPIGASAATASIQGKRVFYTAGPAEVNDLTISVSPSGENYILSDLGATILAGPGCIGSGNTATCPAAGITGITVSAGDGSDSIYNTTSTPSTLSGGDGNDSLEGGSGNDILRGNKGADIQSGAAGDDFIDSRGDKADVVTCGIGTDTVRADAADSVAADCETVDRGGALPPPPLGRTPRPPSPGTGLAGPGETKLKAGACAKDMLGSAGNDRLDGTALGENLFGLKGDDILNGRGGDDCLFGGLGSDWLSGGAGNDRLFGNNGNDRLNGGRGNDRLSGGRGHNVLLGGVGSDTLNSANGKFDRVNCGSGRDKSYVDRIDHVRGCERVIRRR